MIVGGVSGGLSELVGNLPTGGRLNDPLFLALSIQGLLRGLLYFNWLKLVVPLSFAGLLGAFSVGVVQVLASRAGRMVLVNEAAQAARSAAVLSALPVLLREVDAISLALWYGFATWLSALFAGFAARRFIRIRSPGPGGAPSTS